MTVLGSQLDQPLLKLTFDSALQRRGSLTVPTVGELSSESAAASRAKVRDRISELETEVDVWKKRYQAALERMGPDAASAFEVEEEQRAAEAAEQPTANI